MKPTGKILLDNQNHLHLIHCPPPKRSWFGLFAWCIGWGVVSAVVLMGGW